MLKADLKAFHNVLRKWPDPPTFSAMVTFGALHNGQVKEIRQQIIRHQLEFTIFLSKATFLPEEDDLADALSSLLRSDSTLGPEDRINETDAQIFHNADTYDPLVAAEIENRGGSSHRVWTELVNLLLTLPRTLRLSHFVQKLQDIHKITASSAFPELSAFNFDVENILNLAKELDKRLLGENHFSKDVQREM